MIAEVKVENFNISNYVETKTFNLDEGDEIWVSANSFEEHWLQPGTLIVNREFKGLMANYKLSPMCYFRVVEATYRFKPKWWQFWKEPVVDGYKLRVWKAMV